MLSELRIRNLAIIDELSMQFKDGMTVLSGETGAGKSIIINAVNLLLGSRATSKMIRTGAETAEIEALFFIPGRGDTMDILAQQGYDPAEELLIRRIITRSDRHRVYINGRLATMQLLSAVTENLAAISGQHEHQKLLNETRHLLILDRFGGLMPMRAELHGCYREILPLIKKLSDLKASAQKQEEHLQLMAFQKKEIEEAGITQNEDEALKQELARIKNAQMLCDTVQGAIESLYSAGGSVIENVGEIRKCLEKAAAVDSALAAPAEDLSDAAFRIEDIAERLRSYLNGVEFDPRRLEEIESRLDLLNRLKRKYGGSLEAVLEQLAVIETELSDMENLSERIAGTEKQLDKKHQQLIKLAAGLTRKRKKAAAQLAKKVENELKSLEMAKTRFAVSFDAPAAPKTPSPYLMAAGGPISETGAEQARFMISPNVGEDLKPLSAIASGGELSRVILALKSIMADNDAAGTMIFDEVDAGIGGTVAEVVGKKLADLSAYNQIICITHLARIASFARHHFKISKHVENRRTVTRISPLNEKERLEETARMLGGAKITKATRDHAREILKAGRAYAASASN